MRISVLTKKQVKTFSKYFIEDGQKYKINVNVRYDDECGNGHNTLAITGDIYEIKRSGRLEYVAGGCIHVAGGCIHEDIKKHFPELKKYIKWHLCTSEGPMNYIANTLYFAGDKDCKGKRKGEERDFDAARKTSIWEDATDEELSQEPEELRKALEARLPALMDSFVADIEELGFIF